MKHVFEGQVARVLIAPDADSIESQPLEEVEVTLEGFEGDRHSGLTYRTGGRTLYYPRGTVIRNSRQVSIVSVEELAEIAAGMNVPQVEPGWIGANLLLQSIPALTLLPPASRLFFARDAVLVVEGENLPCTTSGAAIQARYPDVPDLAQGFPKAGLHKRGVVAWVERPGVIRVGDTVRVEVPEQVLYPGTSG